ncbi:MAG TPA: hypothetical protein VEQ85_09820 [Lacipirellulaceae bacterium]|nr:hypothetical protein [Lacipirellulaceae bacterium]
MPDELNSPEPHAAAGPPSKASNTWKSLLLGVLGIAAVVVGLIQVYRGLGQAFGWSTPAYAPLLQASDEASSKATAAARQGDEQLQSLVGVLNAEPLETIRSDHRDAVAAAQKALAEASAQFETAGAKLEEALSHEMPESAVAYLRAAREMYHLNAEGYKLRAGAAAAVLDETIVRKEALIAKLNDLIDQATVALTAAEAAAKKTVELRDAM